MNAIYTINRKKRNYLEEKHNKSYLNIRIILDRIKSIYDVKFSFVAELLGITADQLSSVRTGRRKIKGNEIEVLIEKYPLAFDEPHYTEAEPIEGYVSPLQELRTMVQVQAKELDDLRRRVSYMEVKMGI